jgi:hypothetical protein
MDVRIVKLIIKNYYPMDSSLYTKGFQKAVDQIDRKLLDEKQLNIWIGKFLECDVLKIFKKSWANPSEDTVTSPSRIFFSIWVEPAKEEKLFYNIHALKLRQLKGYKIESRKFAETFRKVFKEYSHKWENVSTKFGPLTLMQGSVSLHPDNFPTEVLGLSNNFLEIEHLIDNTLAGFKL